MTHWTYELNKYLKEYGVASTDQKLAENLSFMTQSTVTIEAVRQQRRKLGIKKPRGRKARH